MDLPNDPRKKQIVFQTVERSEKWEDPEEWFVGYFIAVDRGATHTAAMDLADQYMREVTSGKTKEQERTTDSETAGNTGGVEGR